MAARRRARDAGGRGRPARRVRLTADFTRLLEHTQRHTLAAYNDGRNPTLFVVVNLYDGHRLGDYGTEQWGAQGVRPAASPRRRERPVSTRVHGIGTVGVERAADYDQTRTWLVAVDGATVASVRPCWPGLYSARPHWQPYLGAAVVGRPCRTGRDAVAAVLAAWQRRGRKLSR